MDNLIGKTLGQYEILEEIGHGGMAYVFKAYQPALNRFVAIKVLPPILAHESGFTQRFQREALAVARLNHPNILQVHDFGIQRDYHYIVMRYVENSVTLKTLLKEGISVDLLIDYVVQVAEALNYAHERGIIHRDIKPANILIDGQWALLSDFGLVKETESTSHLTTTGHGMGTPAYMSPEQAMGSTVDQRTDIYALGIILYEILTGTVPHDAPAPQAILLKRTSDPVPPPRQVDPNIPESLEHVTLRALAREPESRYATATHFSEALQKAMQDPHYRESITLPQLTGATVAIDSSTQKTTTAEPSAQILIGSKYLRLMLGVAVAAVVVIGLLLFVLPIPFFEGGSSTAQPTPPDTPDTVDAPAVVAETASPTNTPPPPTHTPTPIPPSTPMAVAKTKLEVWSGPGDDYEMLGYLPAGARVEVTSRDPTGRWWQIKTSLSPAGTGWIGAGDDFTSATDTDTVPIALAPPTSTPLPPPTPTDTSTPHPTATDTPTPTVSPPSPTTAAAASPAPTATPTLPTHEIILLKPVSLEEPSYGITEFEWQWKGPLAESQGFEVRVWRDGESPAGVHNAVLDNQNGTLQSLGNNTYRLVTDITEAYGVRKIRGEYNWTVVLVQIEPEYEDLGIQAPPARFRFELPGTGGDGGLIGGN